MEPNETDMSPAGAVQDTVIPCAEAPTERPGLAASALPALAFAILFAAGATLLQTLIARSSGSYVAWEIVFACILVWAAAALALWIAATAVLLPVLLFVRGRARLAILPAAVVAGGFIICAFGIRPSFTGKDALGASIVLSTWFLVPWGLVVGALTAGLAARMPRGRRWQVTVSGIVSILFTSGLTYFIWDNAKAYTLAVGPVALICAGAVAVEKLRGAKAAASVVLVATIAFLSMLVVLYYQSDSRPAGPIDKHFKPDPGLTAMLAGKPNVIIVVLDTARADHMSLCGYKYPTTPNLVKLAAESRLFPHAESVDSWTLPAHASLFTGKYPREHGAHADETIHAASANNAALWGRPLPESQTTMAELLAAKGYNTAAFAANYAWLCRQLNLNQGFAYYHDMPRFLVFNPEIAPLIMRGADVADRILGLNGKFVEQPWNAEAVTKFAQRWVRTNKNAPFFLFLNYMDAHGPYSPPPPYDHIDGPGIPIDDRLSHQATWSAFRYNYKRNGTGLTPETAKALSNQYDGELAYLDHWIGRLVESLKAQGVFDDALIVITCDHGEYLGEHQLLSHGCELYEGALRVPILVKYPRGEHAGEVITTRASIIDVFATVLDALRLPAGDVPARALGSAPRPVFGEAPQKSTAVEGLGDHLISVYDGPWKYIRSSSGHHELFDLVADPGESSDQSAVRPADVARFDAAINDWTVKTPVLKEAAPTGGSSKGDMLHKLKSLGYIGG